MYLCPNWDEGRGTLDSARFEVGYVAASTLCPRITIAHDVLYYLINSTPGSYIVLSMAQGPGDRDSLWDTCTDL